MAERQYGKTLGEIRQDHVNRYKFASQWKGKILDAACGTGYGSRILHDAGSRVIGLDISGEAINAARTNWPGPEYHCFDLSVFNFQQDFDIAVSFETLEHIKEPKPVLDGFRRCAKTLICSVPNENLYPFEAANFASDQYPHFRHYTPEEFDELLNASGWHVIEKHCQKSKTGEVEHGTDGIFLVYVCE